jgi:hypothetical protein
MLLWKVAVIVLLLNIPFGYWRGQAQSYSRQWFFAIHLPVPLVIVIRIASGLGWQFITFPVMIAAFFAGQLVGSTLHNFAQRISKSQVSACLVWDVVTGLRKMARNGLN